MPGQEEKEMLVQLAELRQQMVAMSTSVEEIKSSVREVIQLDRTIAELSIHYQQQAREIQTQWGKIDADHKEIERVDKKADEFINKARGAWATLLIVDITLREIRQVSAQYTQSNKGQVDQPKEAGATPQADNGKVQPKTPEKSTLKSLADKLPSLADKASSYLQGALK